MDVPFHKLFNEGESLGDVGFGGAVEFLPQKFDTHCVDKAVDGERRRTVGGRRL